MSGSCLQLWDSPELVEARKAPQRQGRWRSDKKMLLLAFCKRGLGDQKGCWLLVVVTCFVVGCCWLLVVGCWLLVVGCWLLVVGCWLLVVGCWLLVVGCWLLVVVLLLLLLFVVVVVVVVMIFLDGGWIIQWLRNYLFALYTIYILTVYVGGYLFALKHFQYTAIVVNMHVLFE